MLRGPVSRRVTHSRCGGLLGGAWDRACRLVPGLEGLAGGKAGASAASADGGDVAAGGFLGEQDPDELGGIPALRPGGRDHLGGGLAQIRQAQPAGQRDRLGSGSPAGAVTAAGSGGWDSPLAARLAAELGPGGGARLQAVGLGGTPCRAAGAVALVVQDGSQVAVVEPAGQRHGPKRLVDRADLVELGERDRLGHLGADPAGAGGGGLQQPLPGTLAKGQERGLLGTAGPGLAFQRARRAGRVVLVRQLRAARGRAGMPGDLGRPLLAEVVTTTSSPTVRTQTRSSISPHGTE